MRANVCKILSEFKVFLALSYFNNSVLVYRIQIRRNFIEQYALGHTEWQETNNIELSKYLLSRKY